MKLTSVAKYTRKYSMWTRPPLSMGYTGSEGSSQNWMMPKKTKLFSFPLTPCPPQKTKKTMHIWHNRLHILRPEKQIKHLKTSEKKIGSDHKMVFGWNGNFEINPMHSLIFLRVFEMKSSQFVQAVHNITRVNFHTWSHKPTWSQTKGGTATQIARRRHGYTNSAFKRLILLLLPFPKKVLNQIHLIFTIVIRATWLFPLNSPLGRWSRSHAMTSFLKCSSGPSYVLWLGTCIYNRYYNFY